MSYIDRLQELFRPIDLVGIGGASAILLEAISKKKMARIWNILTFENPGCTGKTERWIADWVKETADRIDRIDPTPAKEHAEWLAKLVRNDLVDLYSSKDMEKIARGLERYHKLQELGRWASHAPEHYAGSADFLDQVDSHADVPAVSKRQEERMRKEMGESWVNEPGAQTIFANDKWAILALSTVEQAVKRCAKGNCTHREQQAKHYLASGPLYIFFLKNQKRGVWKQYAQADYRFSEFKNTVNDTITMPQDLADIIVNLDLCDAATIIGFVGELSSLEMKLLGEVSRGNYHNAFDYAREEMSRDWPELEELLLRTAPDSDGFYLLLYIDQVKEGRWPGAEEFMLSMLTDKNGSFTGNNAMKDGIFEYGRHYHPVWPELEAAIIKAVLSDTTNDGNYFYVAMAYIETRKRRWPDLESALLQKAASREYAGIYTGIRYCVSVVGGRWPELERTLLAQGEWAIYTGTRYAIDVIKGRWPELEQLILADGYQPTDYIKKIMDGHWTEYASMASRKIREGNYGPAISLLQATEGCGDGRHIQHELEDRICADPLGESFCAARMAGIVGRIYQYESRLVDAARDDRPRGEVALKRYLGGLKKSSESDDELESARKELCDEMGIEPIGESKLAPRDVGTSRDVGGEGDGSYATPPDPDSFEGLATAARSPALRRQIRSGRLSAEDLVTQVLERMYDEHGDMQAAMAHLAFDTPPGKRDRFEGASLEVGQRAIIGYNGHEARQVAGRYTDVESLRDAFVSVGAYVLDGMVRSSRKQR